MFTERWDRHCRMDTEHLNKIYVTNNLENKLQDLTSI